MSTPQIHARLAMLAQLKTMNPPREPRKLPALIVKRSAYKRSAEEQAQMDRIAREFEELERGA